MIDKSKFNIKKEWRKFGYGLTVILTIIGTVNLLISGQYYFYFYLAASIILMISLLIPILLKPVFIFFTYLGLVMGWVMTRIILTILFYLIITPIGFIIKMSGKKFLELKIDKNLTSYWIKKDKTDIGSYENQY